MVGREVTSSARVRTFGAGWPARLAAWRMAKCVLARELRAAMAI